MLRIHNSKTGALEEFKIVEPGKVKIYVCGATVQSSPHIGHMRVAVCFDIVRRWFESQGLTVDFVRNVTDIDDKILNKSREAGRNWKDHAKHFEGEFSSAYNSLGCLPPTSEPHATKFIGEQIALIKQIEAAGYAYRGDDGNCWFDTASWKDYGELTHQDLSKTTESSDEDARADKRNPRDFALWKAPNEGDPEDASWDSPWGRGRPGWHIECSAMSGALLGDEFDIHGGGLDLRFPHHENEVAQSRAAGRKFARTWMHSAWVTAKGEKMSKSLGNYLAVSEVCGEGPTLSSLALRFALAAAHYRTMIEWTSENLLAATKTVERLRKFLVAAEEQGKLNGWKDVELPEGFVQAMEDDFNTPVAVREVFEAVNLGTDISVNCCQVRKMLSVLGLDPLDAFWASAFDEPADNFSEEEVARISAQIEERKTAKVNKNFNRADEIRDQLLAEGIQLIDTPAGTEFKRV